MNGLDCVKKKDLDKVKVGDQLCILGHPLGQMLKYAEGTVKDPHPDGDESRVDAWITGFPGNSGSPVFRNGEVVGVYTSATGAERIHAAIQIILLRLSSWRPRRGARGRHDPEGPLRSGHPRVTGAETGTLLWGPK